MKFKSYHKIRQFKDVARAIKLTTEFTGEDENNEPIYEESKVKPIINFHGTVKLHGTNAGIMYDGKTVQPIKRNGIVTERHQGFYEWVFRNGELEEEMKLLWLTHAKQEEYIIVYGEWAGIGIQKGVAINGLPKHFYVFDVKVVKDLGEIDAQTRWLDTELLEFRYLTSIYNYETYEITIDFNEPEDSVPELERLVLQVEKQCPVASVQGKSGIGEGIVWRGFWEGQRYIFKTKGEKHKSVREKKLVTVGLEKIAGIQAFADYACTEVRILQGISETGAKEKRDIPLLLKWVGLDIFEEEIQMLNNTGLEWRDVNKEVSKRTREFFFKHIE